jgi:hypothetical protein
MGHRRHHGLKCHSCKRRKALGGSKAGGNRAEGERAGWVHGWEMARDAVVWLCPPGARKRGPKTGG